MGLQSPISMVTLTQLFLLLYLPTLVLMRFPAKPYPHYESIGGQHICSSNESSLPELPIKTCWTCADRCGTAPEAFALPCGCDSECEYYKDCCPGFSTFCPHLSVGQEGVRSSCHRLPIGMLQHGRMTEKYKLVDSCSQTGKSCVGADPSDLSQLDLAVPVTDRTTNVSYLNTKCALCNGVFSIRPFNLKIDCISNLTELGQGPKEQDIVNLVLNRMARRECWVVYIEKKQRHGCECSTITQCPEHTCENPEVVEKCEEGVSDPVSPDGSMFESYKNIYCAFCNLEVVDYFSCFPPYNYGMQGWSPMVLASFSLTLLFDFNSMNDGIVLVAERCEAADMIYMEETSKCERRTCLTHQTLKEGKCVSNERNMTYIIALDFTSITAFQVALSNLEQTSQMQVLHAKMIEKTQEYVFQKSAIWYPPEIASANQSLFISVPLTLTSNDSFVIVPEPSDTVDTYITDQIVLSLVEFLDHIEVLESSYDLVTSIEGHNITSRHSECRWVLLPMDNFILHNDSLYHVNITSSVFTRDRFVLINNETVMVCAIQDLSLHSTEPDYNGIPPYILGLVTIICLSLSLLALGVRIIAHCICPCFRTHAGELQLQLCIALFLSFASLLAGGVATSSDSSTETATRGVSICIVFASLIYVCFLAAFFWMTIVAIDAFTTFRPSSHFSKRSEKGKGIMIGYASVCWGIPLLLLALTLAMDYTAAIPPQYKPDLGVGGSCWFKQPYPLIIFFIAPVTCLLVIAFIFFLLTLWHLTRAMKGQVKIQSKASHGHQRQHIAIYARLAVIMGVSWLLGVVAAFVQNNIFWLVFILLNGLQGVLIFFAFVCRRSVIRSMRKGRPSSSRSETTESSRGVAPNGRNSRPQSKNRKTSVKESPSTSLRNKATSSTAAFPAQTPNDLMTTDEEEDDNQADLDNLTNCLVTGSCTSLATAPSSVCTVEQINVYVDSDECVCASLKENCSCTLSQHSTLADNVNREKEIENEVLIHSESSVTLPDVIQSTKM